MGSDFETVHGFIFTKSDRNCPFLFSKGLGSYLDFGFSTVRSVPSVHEDWDETKILCESRPHPFAQNLH